MWIQTPLGPACINFLLLYQRPLEAKNVLRQTYSIASLLVLLAAIKRQFSIGCYENAWWHNP